MIKYIKGDLLNAEQTILVHQVNCQGVMGSGIAKLIKDKYPGALKAYLNQIDTIDKSELLGSVSQYNEDGRFILNLISQDQYLPRGIRHTNYEALKEGFETIKDVFPNRDIAMPKIGCGLGGGNWKVVSGIIESVFDDRDIYIYEL